MPTFPGISAAYANAHYAPLTVYPAAPAAHSLLVGNGAAALNALAPGAARNVAISNGTDWGSRALQAADLPSLSGIYQPLDATLTTLSGKSLQGSGDIVLASSPTIITPTVASLTNMQHSHQDAAGGGSLDAAAIGSGVLANARVNWAAPGTIGSTTPNTGAFLSAAITTVDPNSSTNTILDLLSLTHDATNAGTGGTGVGIPLFAKTSVQVREIARIRALLSNGTDATYVGQLVLSGWKMVTGTPTETDLMTLSTTQIQFANENVVPTSDAGGSLGTTSLRWGGFNFTNGIVSRIVAGAGTLTNPSIGLNGAITDTAGLYYPTTRTMGFVTGLTEKMRLDTVALTFTDAINLVFGTTTGTKIGTVGGASGQKIGFFGATAIVQPLLATGAGATVDNVITVLQNLGLVRQS